MRDHRAVFAVIVAGGAAVILPVPPTPPAGGPPDHAAPVPSLTLAVPGQDQPDGVRVSPEFFSLGRNDDSAGYTPGSQIEELPGRRQPLRAGFSVSIPIQ